MLDKIRSVFFTVIFYAIHAGAAILALPMLLCPVPWMVRYIELVTGLLNWMESHVMGIKTVILYPERLNTGVPMIVALKHQSAWETMKLHRLLKNPAIILKQELTRIPIWGWYLNKVGLIAVNRGGGSDVLRDMVRQSQDMFAQGRPIAIFPQGTRVPVGVWKPYKFGVGRLYEALNVPIVPVALNSGVLWPRKAFFKKSGTITVEVLEAIPAGLSIREAMTRLETALEEASNRLAVQIGGVATPSPTDEERRAANRKPVKAT